MFIIGESGLTKGVGPAVTRNAMLAWLRRLIVSVGIGGASYAFMLGIMILSVVYNQGFEPIITFAFDAGRSITNW